MTKHQFERGGTNMIRARPALHPIITAVSLLLSAVPLAYSQQAQQRLSASDSLYQGWLYQVGNGVPKDPAMAVRFYADAANQGLPDAMYRLALMYSDGNGVRQDSATAVKWFYEAGKRGHAAAQMDLGFALVSGDGVRRDDVAGFRWLLLAAQAGLPRAQGGLAALYANGRGVTQNDSEAAAWYRKAAEQGQIVAMYEVGQSLRMGRGVAKNGPEAIQWYEKSARAGYAPAQTNLGSCYSSPNCGVTPDYHLAAYWLSEAARQGDSLAQLDLGMLYAAGAGVDRNVAQARALYAQAARSSEPQVAERAQALAAALPDSSDETLPGHPAQSSTATAVIGLAATVAVGAVLISLLSGSSSDDSAAAAPSNGTSSLAGPSGSNTPAPAPAPHCHPVSVEDPFTTQHGTDLVSPRGATTLVCD